MLSFPFFGISLFCMAFLTRVSSPRRQCFVRRIFRFSARIFRSSVGVSTPGMTILTPFRGILPYFIHFFVFFDELLISALLAPQAQSTPAHSGPAEGIFRPRGCEVYLIPFFIHFRGWGGLWARGRGVRRPWHAAVSWGARRAAGMCRPRQVSDETARCRRPCIAESEPMEKIRERHSRGRIYAVGTRARKGSQALSNDGGRRESLGRCWEYGTATGGSVPFTWLNSDRTVVLREVKGLEQRGAVK